MTIDDHGEIQARFGDHLDGALGASERDALLRHLAACAPCAAAWRRYESAVELLRSRAPEPTAPAHVAAVMARVRAAKDAPRIAGASPATPLTAPHARRAPRRVLSHLCAAAAGVAAALGIGSYALERGILGAADTVTAAPDAAAIAALREELREELRGSLGGEVRDALRAELRGDMQSGVRAELAVALRPEVEAALRPEVASALRAEMSAAARAEADSALREALRAELLAEVDARVARDREALDADRAALALELERERAARRDAERLASDAAAAVAAATDAARRLADDAAARAAAARSLERFGAAFAALATPPPAPRVAPPVTPRTPTSASPRPRVAHPAAAEAVTIRQEGDRAVLTTSGAYDEVVPALLARLDDPESSVRLAVEQRLADIADALGVPRQRGTRDGGEPWFRSDRGRAAAESRAGRASEREESWDEWWTRARSVASN